MRIPEGYEEHPDSVMSNCDHEINNAVVEIIKDSNLWALYPGWNFCGYVWWDRETKRWFCEVWTYNSYKQTFQANDLQQIMDDVSDEYGGN